MKNKKIKLLIILTIIILLLMPITQTTEAKTIKLKVNAGISNGKMYAKIGNVKIKSNKQINNKVLKLVNISI